MSMHNKKQDYDQSLYENFDTMGWYTQYQNWWGYQSAFALPYSNFLTAPKSTNSFCKNCGNHSFIKGVPKAI